MSTDSLLGTSWPASRDRASRPRAYPTEREYTRASNNLIHSQRSVFPALIGRVCVRTSMGGPSFKSRRVSRHGGEIAVVQPVENLLLLANAGPPLTVIRPDRMWPQRHLRPLLGRLTVIGLDEAAADEQDISDPDVSALCLRPDVDALVLAALVQFFETDGIVVVRVVLDPLLVGISAVIEQDAPTGNAVFGPVVDGAFVVGFGANDVLAVGVVVESPCRDMRKLDRSDPLSMAELHMGSSTSA